MLPTDLSQPKRISKFPTCDGLEVFKADGIRCPPQPKWDLHKPPIAVIMQLPRECAKINCLWNVEQRSERKWLLIWGHYLYQENVGNNRFGREVGHPPTWQWLNSRSCCLFRPLRDWDKAARLFWNRWRLTFQFPVVQGFPAAHLIMVSAHRKTGYKQDNKRQPCHYFLHTSNKHSVLHILSHSNFITKLMHVLSPFPPGENQGLGKISNLLKAPE